MKGFSQKMLIFAALNELHQAMDIEQIREYALTLTGVTEDMPYGDDVLAFRIEGKIFMLLFLGAPSEAIAQLTPRFAVKLLPERNVELRERYPSITPAWHCNKKHWSDVRYGQVEDTLAKELISESYRLVVSQLPRTQRAKYEEQ